MPGTEGQEGGSINMIPLSNYKLKNGDFYTKTFKLEMEYIQGLILGISEDMVKFPLYLLDINRNVDTLSQPAAVNTLEGRAMQSLNNALPEEQKIPKVAVRENVNSSAMWVRCSNLYDFSALPEALQEFLDVFYEDIDSLVGVGQYVLDEDGRRVFVSQPQMENMNSEYLITIAECTVDDSLVPYIERVRAKDGSVDIQIPKMAPDVEQISVSEGFLHGTINSKAYFGDFIINAVNVKHDTNEINTQEVIWTSTVNLSKNSLLEIDVDVVNANYGVCFQFIQNGVPVHTTDIVEL